MALDISIDTAMGDGVDNFLEPILKNVNVDSVVLSSDTLHFEEDAVYASVKFILKQNKPQESIVAFNGDGKILFIDYFDRLFGQSRYRKSSPAGAVPFRLDGESVVLSLRLNDSDHPLSFLLDTGANYHLIVFSDFVQRNRLQARIKRNYREFRPCDAGLPRESKRIENRQYSEKQHSRNLISLNFESITSKQWCGRLHRNPSGILRNGRLCINK